MTAKGVNFAESNLEPRAPEQRKAAVDQNQSGGDTGSGVASRRKRLQREKTTSVVVDNTPPAWLANIGTDGPADNVTSTEDIMDEFLWNEDMLNLEVMCMRWQGLDSSEIESLAKISPHLADSLVIGDKHMSAFLNYRRKLAEKQNRKVHLRQSMLKRTGSRVEEAVEEVEEEDDDIDEELEDNSPAPKGRKTFVRIAPSSTPTPSIEASKAAEEKDSKDRESRKSMFARKKSLSVNTKAAAPHTSRLARAGSNIAGQDEADTSLPKATRSSIRKLTDPSTPRAEKHTTQDGEADTSPQKQTRSSIRKLTNPTTPRAEKHTTQDGEAETSPSSSKLTRSSSRKLSRKATFEAVPKSDV